MRKLIVTAVATLLCGTAVSAASAAAPVKRPSGACDRSCMVGISSAYLAALAAKDPKRVPAAPNVRFTEEGVAIPLGDGLWNSIDRLGPYRNDFVDVASGQIATFQTFYENGRPGIMSVRLKVVNRKITEIETVLGRNARGAATMPPIDPLWAQIEPVGKRLTRDQLIAGSKAYMKAISTSDGSVAPMSDETCIRLENGNLMALSPKDKPPIPVPTGADTGDWMSAVRQTIGTMTCKQQISTGIYKFITSYENARVPLVDVERQVTFAQFNFRRRGNVKGFTMPNGKYYPVNDGALWPNEALLGEVFKFVDGKIVRVEGIFTAGQVYKAGTGWSSK